LLGAGSFGKVYRGKRKSDELKVAVKVLQKKEMTKEDLEHQTLEIGILRVCQSKHVSQIIDLFEDSY
jgi:serine/threonine protein kinase